MSHVLIIIAIAAMIVAAMIYAVRVVALALKARRKTRGAERNALWERIYGLDWGNVTTNNYGFAPAAAVRGTTAGRTAGLARWMAYPSVPDPEGSRLDFVGRRADCRRIERGAVIASWRDDGDA